MRGQDKGCHVETERRKKIDAVIGTVLGAALQTGG